MIKVGTKVYLKVMKTSGVRSTCQGRTGTVVEVVGIDPYRSYCIELDRRQFDGGIIIQWALEKEFDRYYMTVGEWQFVL